MLDLCEPGGGPGGSDLITEIKVCTPLVASHAAGQGSTVNGGTPTSVGHLHAFGNTEEKLRLINLGCRERGHPSQRALDHTNGRGWVKARRGCYYDALVRKRNPVCLTLHESLGGGFSPPAAARLHTLARVARAGADRTRYSARRRLSYINHHSQRISLSIVKADSAALLHASRRLVTSLQRM